MKNQNAKHSIFYFTWEPIRYLLLSRS